MYEIFFRKTCVLDFLRKPLVSLFFFPAFSRRARPSRGPHRLAGTHVSGSCDIYAAPCREDTSFFSEK